VLTTSLSVRELQALYDTPLETENGAPFFQALERVESIRSDCKQLISSSLQAAGIEILENMAQHQVRGRLR
jgi:hypothetical protein